MHRMTKLCNIPSAVKAEVWGRDGGRCIFCGSSNAAPNMHFVPRSHGGLGIPKNIGTGCIQCHIMLDNSGARPMLLEEFEWYLKSKYPDWDREQLIYRKW